MTGLQNFSKNMEQSQPGSGVSRMTSLLRRVSSLSIVHRPLPSNDPSTFSTRPNTSAPRNSRSCGISPKASASQNGRPLDTRPDAMSTTTTSVGRQPIHCEPTNVVPFGYTPSHALLAAMEPDLQETFQPNMPSFNAAPNATTLGRCSTMTSLASRSTKLSVPGAGRGRTSMTPEPTTIDIASNPKEAEPNPFMATLNPSPSASSHGATTLASSAIASTPHTMSLDSTSTGPVPSVASQSSKGGKGEPPVPRIPAWYLMQQDYVVPLQGADLPLGQQVVRVPDMVRAAAIYGPVPPPDNSSDAQRGRLPRPDNNFAGFCKGASMLQLHDSTDKAWHATARPQGNFSEQVIRIQCRECGYWLDREADVAVARGNLKLCTRYVAIFLEQRVPIGALFSFIPILLVVWSGSGADSQSYSLWRAMSHQPTAAINEMLFAHGDILYRVEWLFRCHIPWPGRREPEHAQEGRYRCLFCVAEGRPAFVFWGTAPFLRHLEEHRWRVPTGPVVEHARAVVGRAPHPTEDFAVALPVSAF